MFISPSALMESHTPKRWNSGWSEDNIPFSKECLRILITENKSKMNYSSDSFISDKSLICSSMIYNDIHCIWVSKIVEMEGALLLSQKIKGIKSISLSSRSVVNLLRAISWEYGPFTSSFSKVVFKSLAQSINVSRINLCSYFNVIFAKNEILLIGWE